jgi:hypothetical protein
MLSNIDPNTNSERSLTETETETDPDLMPNPSYFLCQQLQVQSSAIVLEAARALLEMQLHTTRDHDNNTNDVPVPEQTSSSRMHCDIVHPEKSLRSPEISEVFSNLRHNPPHDRNTTMGNSIRERPFEFLTGVAMWRDMVEEIPPPPPSTKTITYSNRSSRV